MSIRIPDAVAGPVFAEGVALNTSGDAVFMNFFITVHNPDGAEQVVVQRIVLSESTLEHFALDLGKIAAERRSDRQG